MVFVQLMLTVCLALWLFSQYLKTKPAYKIAMNMPGPHMYPIVGNLFMLVGLNGGTYMKSKRWKFAKVKQNFTN